MTDYLHEHAFSLPKDPADYDRIARKFTKSGKEIKELSLWRLKDNQYLYPAYQNDDSTDSPTIPFLLTRLEKRWLRTLLEQPICPALLGNTLFKKICTRLDEPSFPWTETILERGVHFHEIPPDSPCLLEKVLHLYHIIRSRQTIRFRSLISNALYTAQPLRILYSPYKNDFEILLRITGKIGQQQVSIADLDDIQPIEPDSASLNNEVSTEESPVHLLIRPIHQNNDIERCFLLFSTNKKEGWLDETAGIYHLIIYYHSFEKEDILRKLLSLGQAVYVSSPSVLQQELQSFFSNP